MLEQLAAEIEGLHGFFVDWFGGRIAPDSEVFNERFAVRIDPQCLLIQPGGETADAETFVEAVRRGHGGSPDFRIVIRNVVIRRRISDNNILVTYEEWQRNAINSKPPDNARVASVLFRQRYIGHPLRWCHIHETWLPPVQTPAERFDF